MHMAPTQSERFSALDQLRAVAVISMINAHFVPGTITRWSTLERIGNLLIFESRLATVAFICVFGFTMGFVFHPRFEGESAAAVSAKLFRRSRFILLCAVVICFPQMFFLWRDGNGRAIDYLFTTYSVLNFYVLAFSSAPLWFTMLSGRRVWVWPLFGVALWSIGAGLNSVWISDGHRSISEYIRINLCSGPYAYFQLSGVALIAVSVGICMHRAAKGGALLHFCLQGAVVGTFIAVFGLCLGLYWAEYDFDTMLSGIVKSPPRVWYWLLFSGPALMLLSTFVVINVWLPGSQRILYPVTLFGQCALAIYTAHTFVLPSLSLLDGVIVIEGLGRVALAASGFGIFCLLVMYRKHQLNANMPIKLGEIGSDTVNAVRS